MEQDILETLAEFDEYLGYFNRGGVYKDSDIGGSISDDRWQAFIDWTKVFRKLNDPDKLDDMSISQHEVPIIRRAAFKIIKQKRVAHEWKQKDEEK